ncbi:HORMA domain-containing protein [Caenorhabditis elegans]|uniref:HORMA domain-containing protein n=1 Tax=Caenorhabditis elegans TaxID=6239 RepID=O01820_CAEEL|nr:HORMA domain-containing protein [Caenorhabditis elegans]CCD62437.1 HORMA domain-containing protein [Caenorhabditis elegans]|eukprot:NP_491458.1 Him-Three Paralog [Caenorhabditis elegans]
MDESFDSSVVPGSLTSDDRAIFNEQTLKNGDENSKSSLEVMANCVYLANSTILRERKVIPAEYFQDFQVYGDVSGYTLRQDIPEGRSVSSKLLASHDAIRQKLLQKLAIVVEESLNTNPVETFVWTFVYDSTTSASAEIGYGGRKSKFVVNYLNMDDTAQQFCKMFSELRNVLSLLRPLPRGLIPSMKVAYRGEPEFVPGFQQVDDFVNPEQINLGAVSFPHGNGFQFAYASKFMVEQPSAIRPPVEVSHFEDDLLNSTITPIEVVRDNTMNCAENPELDEIYFSPGRQEVRMDEDVANESIRCNPSMASEMMVLQSEYNVLIADNDEVPMVVERERSPIVKAAKKRSTRAPAVPITPTEPASPVESPVKEQPQKAPKAQMRRSSKRTTKNNERCEQKEEEPIVNPKRRSARRLVPPVEVDEQPEEQNDDDAQNSLQIDSDAQNSLQIDSDAIITSPEKRNESKSAIPEEAADLDNTTSEKQESSTARYGVSNTSINRKKPDPVANPVSEEAQVDLANGSIPDKRPRKRKYGRVSSILDVADLPTDDTVEEDVRESPIYGRVPSILDVARAEENDAQNDAQDAQNEIAVEGLADLSIDTEQHEEAAPINVTGHQSESVPIIVTEHQSEEAQTVVTEQPAGAASVIAAERHYGRVSSILDVAGSFADVDPSGAAPAIATERHYGRVSSILDVAGSLSDVDPQEDTESSTQNQSTSKKFKPNPPKAMRYGQSPNMPSRRGN